VASEFSSKDLAEFISLRWAGPWYALSIFSGRVWYRGPARSGRRARLWPATAWPNPTKVGCLIVLYHKDLAHAFSVFDFHLGVWPMSNYYQPPGRDDVWFRSSPDGPRNIRQQILIWAKQKLNSQPQFLNI
jgi:hypothetical protein